MGSPDIDRLRLAWGSYARGDLDAFAEVLAADVRWYGAGDPSAGCQDRQAFLQFIRQAHADGVEIELLDLRPVGEKLLAVLQRRHPPAWGEPPQPHGELISMRDGQVSAMVFYPTVAEALEAGSS